MVPLTIGWEYLTGYAVATDSTDRSRVEWPPHPARVFMAIAAAWFETEPPIQDSEQEREEHERQGDVLRLLEGLPAPELWLPPVWPDGHRDSPIVYVPVNDDPGNSKAILQSAPALTRKKQPRHYPKTYVGGTPAHLYWASTALDEKDINALDSLCAKVSRLGHSSSLVRMWAEPREPSDGILLQKWQPTIEPGDGSCRIPSQGLLDSLPEQTRIPEIRESSAYVQAIVDADIDAASAKARGYKEMAKEASQRQREAKERYSQHYGSSYSASLKPPAAMHPKVGLWQGYHRSTDDLTELAVRNSAFDSDLLILAQTGGPTLPSESTLSVTNALRGAIMKHSGVQPPSEWVTGHKPDGSPSDSDTPHLALLPIPFVGGRYADGHLLGVALAFPRDLPRSDRGRVLGSILVDGMGRSKELELRLGALGVMRVAKTDWSERRTNLQRETWTAHPRGATLWASVTPVVLDRFPKANRARPEERVEWEREARSILATACERVGLPLPIHIDVGTTPWHLGTPRAFAKRRRVRSGGTQTGMEARLGEGFPMLQRSVGESSRPQVHVMLQFAEPVGGPVLIGAGRFRGYGFLRPMR